MTGKGGVGKTTITAALARYAHSQGRRVLALDIDKEEQAPSQLLRLLSGSDAVPRNGYIEIEPNLSYGRLAPSLGHAQFLRDQIPFGFLATAALRSKHLQRFLMAAPAFQDLGSVYKMLPYLRAERKDGSKQYDFVIVDLPATGHTLAITSMPEVVLQVFSSGPIANAVREAQKYFYDTEQTGALLVTLPEPLPVSETLELVKGLKGDNVPILGVLMNRVPRNPWTEEEEEALNRLFHEHKDPFLGTWSFQRAQRFKQARDTLLRGLEQLSPQPWLFCSPEQGVQITDKPLLKVADEIACINEGDAI
jgi:anion-transporting  ArsA/GET3 family ATPase